MQKEFQRSPLKKQKVKSKFNKNIKILFNKYPHPKNNWLVVLVNRSIIKIKVFRVHHFPGNRLIYGIIYQKIKN